MGEFFLFLSLDKSVDRWMKSLRYFPAGLDLVVAKSTADSLRSNLIQHARDSIARQVEELGWIDRDKISTFYAEYSRIKPCALSTPGVEKPQPMWCLVGGDERFRESIQCVLKDPHNEENWIKLKKATDNLLYQKGKEPWK